MEKEQPKPPPEPAPEVRDDPRVVAHRCPFCREPVRLDDEVWVACAQCLGRQHAACWDEAGRCAACRHDRSLAPPGRAAARPLRTLAPLLLPLLVVFWLAGLLLLTGRFPPPPPGIAPAPPPEPVVALEPPTPVAAPPAPPLPVIPKAPISSAERLRALRDAELERADAAERARLLGAEGPAEPGGERSSSRQEPFTWIPDGAAEVDVARRLVREHRERALELEGEPAGHVLQAHAWVHAGNPAQAVLECGRALDLDPRHGPAWTVRGWARLALGDEDGAELDLLRGQRLSDDPTWAEVGLGRLAEQRGEHAAARDLYAASLRAGGERLEHPVDHASDLRQRIERLQRLVEDR